MIDPTARVEAGAAIGRDVTIGPYCVIGPHVTIGDGCRLLAHVNLTGHTTIGAAHRHLSVRLARHAAAIGQLSRRSDPSRDRRRLRHPRKRHHEYRHRGRRRRDARSATTASSWSARMSGMIARSATMSRSPTTRCSAAMSASGTMSCSAAASAVHQFVRIGEGAMIVGVSGIRADVIPFGIAHRPARQSGRAQCRRHAAARLSRRHPPPARGLSGVVFRRGEFRRAARAVAANMAAIRWWPRSSPSFAPANAPAHHGGQARPKPTRTHERRADLPSSKARSRIICGGGTLPFAVADCVSERGRTVVLFALRGAADGTAVEHYPHHWAALGQLGRFLRLARAEGCRDVILIGTLVRPVVPAAFGSI